MKKKNSNLRRRIRLINTKAEKALKNAVMKTIRDHARTDDPLVIWQDGKVVLVPPKRLLTQLLKGVTKRNRHGAFDW